MSAGMSPCRRYVTYKLRSVVASWVRGLEVAEAGRGRATSSVVSYAAQSTLICDPD